MLPDTAALLEFLAERRDGRAIAARGPLRDHGQAWFGRALRARKRWQRQRGGGSGEETTSCCCDRHGILPGVRSTVRAVRQARQQAQISRLLRHFRPCANSCLLQELARETFGLSRRVRREPRCGDRQRRKGTSARHANADGSRLCCDVRSLGGTPAITSDELN